MGTNLGWLSHMSVVHGRDGQTGYEVKKGEGGEGEGGGG